MSAGFAVSSQERGQARKPESYHANRSAPVARDQGDGGRRFPKTALTRGELAGCVAATRARVGLLAMRAIEVGAAALIVASDGIERWRPSAAKSYFTKNRKCVQKRYPSRLDKRAMRRHECEAGCDGCEPPHSTSGVASGPQRRVRLAP